MAVVSEILAIVGNWTEWNKVKNEVRKIPELEARIAALEKRLSGGAAEYFCEHCGSPTLKRTGSRPDPVLGAVGVKQLLFHCGKCGKESAFQEK